MRNTLEFDTCQSYTNCDVPLIKVNKEKATFLACCHLFIYSSNYIHIGFASVLHPKLIFILNFTFSVILNLKKSVIQGRKTISSFRSVHIRQIQKVFCYVIAV